MPSLNGITARVVCDGSPLEEYATSIDPDNPSIISCWVASTADKEFAIQYEFETQELCGWSCRFRCDGTTLAHQVYNRTEKLVQISEATDGNDLRPIIFSEIVESDSQELAETENPDLGLIETIVRRIKPEWEPDRQLIHKVAIDESPIHESKKMLGGHRIKLGEPKGITRSNPVRVTYLDSTPYGAFKFYYRPISLLRALGHAPLASSTPTTAMKRSASVLSLSDSSSKPNEESESDAEDDRITKLKQDIHARQDELAKIIKKEGSKHSKHGKRKAKRLKREETHITVPPSVLGGVIDLCSD